VPGLKALAAGTGWPIPAGDIMAGGEPTMQRREAIERAHDLADRVGGTRV